MKKKTWRRKTLKKSRKRTKKINKNKKLEDSLNSGNESNSDINGENSNFFLDSDDSSYENNKIEEENKALEKFIACFNNTSQGMNLNSSFDDISYQDEQEN